MIARLNVGGPAIHVSLLTEKLCPPEYASTLACGQIGPAEGDMTYYAREHGVEPVIIPELGRSLHPVRDLKTLWKVWRLVRQSRPDVVHTHTAKAGFVGRVAAWLAGVPVIVHTFHGHVFHSYFGPMTRVFLVLERLTGRLSSAIVTLTDGLRDELADVYRVAPKDKIRVIGLGLDLGRFAATPRHGGDFRAAFDLPPDAPLIGIVGRIVPVKNHTLFLDAAVLVHEQLPDARFIIVGDGESRAEIETGVDARGLRDAVIFTGWMQDLAPLYADLNANVISSHNEGTPVSIIEALAAGCPVVATAVGGLPDLLDGGRLDALVPPGDAPALAEALVRTITAPPDPAPAQQAMLDRYGIDRLVRDLDALYRELLNSANR